MPQHTSADPQVPSKRPGEGGPEGARTSGHTRTPTPGHPGSWRAGSYASCRCRWTTFVVYVRYADPPERPPHSDMLAAVVDEAHAARDLNDIMRYPFSGLRSFFDLQSTASSYRATFRAAAQSWLQ